MAESAVMGTPRKSRTSVPSRPRPANRRTTPPPARVPWSIRVRAVLARVRPRIAVLPRVLIGVLQLGLTAGLLLLLYGAGNLLFSHVRSAPSFAIGRIDIAGASQLTRPEVERIAGLAVGQNIFQISEDEVRKRLAAEPWIESASVERHLPSSYALQIKERKAVGLLAAGQLYLVSEDGVAFKQLAAGDPADLPLITGIDAASIERDKRGAVADLADAVQLLKEYATAGLSRREPISEVHIETDGTLTAFVGTDATKLAMGRPPFEPKLRRLREVFGQLTTQHVRAKYVLLDNERRPDRVTVRLR